jgi:hypothetical protein
MSNDDICTEFQIATQVHSVVLSMIHIELEPSQRKTYRNQI